VTRGLLAAAALVALLGSARADEPQRVKPSATVEVLDDKAQIDDVISRLKNEPQKPAPKSDPHANRLPPPPPVEKDLKRGAKNPPPPPRRERLERVNHKH